jgi:uncharacterized protein (TIRG00374 family)
MKLKEVIYIILALGFFAWCAIAFKADLAQIKFAPIWVAWDSIILAGALSLVNYVLRILRWNLYLSRLGHSIPFKFSALTYIAGFAFTLSPGKVGEMVRGRYLQKSGIPISSTAAAFFIERLMDLLSMIALATLATASSRYSNLIWGAVFSILALLLFLTVAPWSRIAKFLEQQHALPASVQKVLQSIVRTLVASKQLLQPGILVTGFLIGLLSWGCEGIGLKVISQITPDVSMPILTAIGIYSIAVIVGALSFLPGGLGGTEAVMIAMLNTHGYVLADAILLTLVCRLLTLWLAVLIGWLAVLALRPITTHEIFIAMNTPPQPTPLCVDLDGTLILSDLLLESTLILLKRNPLYVFLFPLWLLKGKAALKAQIAQRVQLNPIALPYNQTFLDWLHTQHQAGRELWLCTASNYRLADLIGTQIPIFTGVLASSDELNLSGRNKAKLLIEKFGENGYDYCGNAHIDLKVWQSSRAAIAVNCHETLSQSAAKLTELAAFFPKAPSSIKPTIKALRLHQWAKNILIFVPLIAAHKLSDSLAIQQALLAFLAFGLCASSVYLLNDMLDLEVDRQHPRKCKRPFAAGSLSLITGFILVPVLLIIASFIASQLPIRYCLVLAAYYLLTLAYSFGLKRIVLIDTISLAGLYTARIIAGAGAIAVPLSFWLLLFSVFLFFSLALVKRYAELDGMQRKGKLKAVGRGYHIEDLPILHSLGTASGNLCVLVLALYINSPEVQSLYKHPQAIWTLCVLMLYWISRVWLKAHRGKMHDDPVVFAMKDSISIAIGLISAIVVSLAV